MDETTQMRERDWGDLQFLPDLYIKYGRHVIAVAIVLLTVFIAVALYRANITRNRLEASAALLTARTQEDMKALVSNYPSSSSAAIAALRLAKLHYDLGDYELALGMYVEFMEQYPRHDMFAIAELGRIHCLEARLQTEEALQGFIAFIESRPKHFLVPQAILGQARCLEQMGKYTDAKVVYEDFIASYSDSGWLSTAEEKLSVINEILEETEASTK
ncbi:MAG: tetratricopeptide repeat protein [Lentisphaerae bacterium]|nr:tetratricopeptide repeat protein [Lentisphaerota bacterium]